MSTLADYVCETAWETLLHWHDPAINIAFAVHLEASSYSFAY
tara:strand:+ start:109 stop:234 length:126 start_codon:yes stop_codon:yes gene_type:complete